MGKGTKANLVIDPNLCKGCITRLSLCGHNVLNLVHMGIDTNAKVLIYVEIEY